MENILTGSVLLFLLDWALRIWFLFYVPRKRAPSSAIAWLLLVFLLPGLGILLFFLIGSPKLSKSRRAVQKETDKLIVSNLQHLPSEKNIFSDNAVR